MAKLTVEHQEEILTFPTDTILELKIEECNIVTVQSQGRGGDWQKLEFKFKVLNIQALGDGSSDITPYENWIGKNIFGSVPARLTDSPENRLRIWAEAIFKTELGVGFELDTDLFLGRKVRGLTSQYNAKGRDGSGQPFKRHQVETLLPFGGEQAAASPAMVGAASAPAAPAADPWGAAPAAATPGDPWGSTLGSDEPPF